jgi:hypothetical protein
MTILRTQLVTLERRLEEFAANQPPDLSRLFNSFEGERKAYVR